MQLPNYQVTDKIKSVGIANLVVSLLIIFITQSPLGDNQWLSWVKDPQVATILVSLAGLAAGYQTPETKYENPEV